MRDILEFSKEFIIDRLGKGYTFAPPPPPGRDFPRDPRSDPWLAFLIALDRAKQGHFDYVPRIVDLYDPEGDYILNYQCIGFVGDAGPDACFDALIRRLPRASSPDDPESLFDYCYALMLRGRLADVPLLLRVYQQYASEDGAYILSYYISFLLERDLTELPDPAEATLADYSDAVITLQRKLAEEFGSEDVLVLKGRRFGVVRTAETILEALQRPYFPPDLRKKFEASTGINCSGFFKDGTIQPLTAAAIVEDFLESPDAQRFEDGVRYFFGHRIP